MQSSGEESTHQDQDDDEDVMNTRNTTSGMGEGTAGESGDSSSDSSKRPRSVVWKFFSLLESRKSIQCQLCGIGNKDGLLSYHGGTTSMREHFKRRHSTAFSEATDIIDISFSTKGKQTKLDRFTHSIVCSQARSKAITELVAGVIIKDLRPISFVDREGFQKLMKYVEPSYCLPSATYFTQLIEYRYEEAITKFNKIYMLLIAYPSLQICGPALQTTLT